MKTNKQKDLGAAMTELAMLAPLIMILGMIFATSSGMYDFLSSSNIKEHQILQEVQIDEAAYLALDSNGLIESNAIAYLDDIYDSLDKSNYPHLSDICLSLFSARSDSCQPSSGDGVVVSDGVYPMLGFCGSLGVITPCKIKAEDQFEKETSGCQKFYLCLYNYSTTSTEVQTAHIGF